MAIKTFDFTSLEQPVLETTLNDGAHTKVRLTAPTEELFERFLTFSKETKKLISVEDHNVIGGLGSAISEVLTEEYPVKLVRMGINDTFGKSGKAIEFPM